MKLKLSGTTLSGLFTTYVVLIPILEFYQSPLPAFNLATFLAMLFIVAILVAHINRSLKVCGANLVPAWIYWGFLTLNVIITAILYKYSLEWSTLGAYFRATILIISILLLGNSYFNLQKALMILEKVLCVAAVSIITNLILYSLAGVNFNLIIHPLITDSIDVGKGIRSGGLYMEPAHYAQSAVLYCAFYLFSAKMREKLNKSCFVLIIAGVLFSTSGQGYLMLGVLYVMWLISQLLSKRSSLSLKILAIGSVVIVVVLAILAYKLPVVQYAMSRLIGEDGSIGGQALRGRTWTNYKFYELSDLQKTFGVGFGHLQSITNGYYMNSMYSYLVQCGYFSLPVFAYLVLYYFFKGPKPIKVHLIMFVMLYMFSSVASVMSLCHLLLYYSSATTQRNL